jgi:flagellin
LQSEASDLLQELQSISVDTEFNGRSLLNGSFGTQSVQIGYRAGDTLSFSIGYARSSSLGKLAIYSGSQNSLAAIGSSAATALTLNGVSIGASTSDGVSISGDSGSALALATAINLKANETNVNAEALATEVTLYIDSFGGSYTGTFGTGDFYLNDTAITGSIASAGDLVAAINNQTSETGVVAELDGTGNVVMTASDGRNIALTLSNSTGNDVYHIFNISANNASGIFAVTASTSLSVGSDDFVTGAIQLYSSKQILISGGASVSASIGIATGAKALVSGTSATNVTLSSASNATQAIKILDAVIDDISTLRAEIGAVHSRLDYRAAMLIDQQFGLEDAKTRIGGTDFALEVAKLTAAQILQNSGLAALAQANVQRSTVQSLLGLLG